MPKLIELHADFFGLIGNSLDDCYPQDDNKIQDAGFKDYEQFSWALFLIIVVGCCGLLRVSFMYGKYKDGALFISDSPQLQVSEPSEDEGSEPPGPATPQTIDRDCRYAIEPIGKDSAYKFFLSDNMGGWGIALAVVVAQILMLCVFVQGSDNQDLSNDNSDSVYTWKCPRDRDVCRDKLGTIEIVFKDTRMPSHSVCVCAHSH